MAKSDEDKLQELVGAVSTWDHESIVEYAKEKYEYELRGLESYELHSHYRRWFPLQCQRIVHIFDDGEITRCGAMARFVFHYDFMTSPEIDYDGTMRRHSERRVGDTYLCQTHMDCEPRNNSFNPAAYREVTLDE